jgi:hypothetical protein
MVSKAKRRLHSHVSFTATGEEKALAKDCVYRAVDIGISIAWNDKQGLEMDLLAVHANGCPLDFEYLFSSDKFSFIHDIYGIQRHIDRETGQLQNNFVPRCAKPSENAS